MGPENSLKTGTIVGQESKVMDKVTPLQYKWDPLLLSYDIFPFHMKNERVKRYYSFHLIEKDL
ncbi:hypothetical protein HMI56_006611 [Coelomomyces lativittatus]|nr:hypothetical protein HMI56_006611 [Coelomomyces lativittatus]